MELANGLRLAERIVSQPILFPEGLVVYEVATVEAGSDWAQAGLSEGDAILMANGSPFSSIEPARRIELMSDPEARLLIMKQLPGGGGQTVETTLREARDIGLMGAP